MQPYRIVPLFHSPIVTMLEFAGGFSGHSKNFFGKYREQHRIIRFYKMFAEIIQLNWVRKDYAAPHHLIASYIDR